MSAIKPAQIYGAAIAALAVVPAVGTSGQIPILPWPSMETGNATPNTKSIPTLALGFGASADFALTNPDQWYYWTTEWQHQEAVSRAELLSGKGIHFDSADDLITWLSEPDT